MGKINMRIFYGKLYVLFLYKTFSLENGESFIEGMGLYLFFSFLAFTTDDYFWAYQ